MRPYFFLIALALAGCEPDKGTNQAAYKAPTKAECDAKGGTVEG